LCIQVYQAASGAPNHVEGLRQAALRRPNTIAIPRAVVQQQPGLVLST
jgi:hypothetical protein